MVIRRDVPVDYASDSTFSKAIWDLQAAPLLGITVLTVFATIAWRALRALSGLWGSRA